ncbi:MAG: ribulose-phosphate 3-epimerase [bacterium]|nr:ribulose-phosphate 3-epimerase [bacterium]
MLGADLARLGEEVAAVEAAGVELLHLDIMDGVFVPNISFGADVCAAIARHATVPLDCHLMIERPERYLEVFREAGCHGLTVHLETMSDPIATLKQIRALGGLAGLAVNPSTELPPVGPLWEHLDLLLVMSVQPGFCGQSFHPEVLGKLESARALREETGLEFALQIDGGVGPAVAGAARAAGADIMVAASAIMGREDRAAAALEMRQAAG